MSDAPLPISNSPAEADRLFRPRLGLRRGMGVAFQVACVLLSLIALIVLVTLLAQVLIQGWALLGYRFLVSLPSTLSPETAGVWPALCGTLWIITLTALLALPLGVGAAIWLEEYAPRNWFTRLIGLNIENLAGVPSIVYGLLGLALFVRWWSLDRSVAAGALTLGLLVLPVVIIASREALRAVPNSIRLAAFGLGATRWQCVRHHVLPAALPGILTGVILALSRAIGEAAPLLIVGGVAYITHAPGEGLMDYLTPYEDETGGVLFVLRGLFDWGRDTLTSPFTALPIQIYNWAGEAHVEFHRLAGAAIVVLLAILLTMNAVAVGIRAWRQRTRPW